jgi:hypothetical protein
MGKRMKNNSKKGVNPIDVYNFIRLNYPELNIQPLNKVPVKIEYSPPIPDYIADASEYILVLDEAKMITRNILNHNRFAAELYNQNRKMIRNLTAEHKDLWISVCRMMRGPKKKKNDGESENVG